MLPVRTIITNLVSKTRRHITKIKMKLLKNHSERKFKLAEIKRALDVSKRLSETLSRPWASANATQTLDYYKVQAGIKASNQQAKLKQKRKKISARVNQ